MQSATKENRERWTFRLTLSELEMLEMASKIEGVATSKFVRESALAEANRVIDLNKRLGVK